MRGSRRSGCNFWCSYLHTGGWTTYFARESLQEASATVLIHQEVLLVCSGIMTSHKEGDEDDMSSVSHPRSTLVGVQGIAINAGKQK